MNVKKFILLGLLLLPAAAHAAPATLEIVVSTPVVPGTPTQVALTFRMGAGVLGVGDFLLTYDTGAVTLNGISAKALEFQEGFYTNTTAPGKIHLLALNGAGISVPTGSVLLATMTFTPVAAVNSELNAQVFALFDTAPTRYDPVTVIPGLFMIEPSSPKGLHATPGDTVVTLSWTPGAEADIAGYNIYRNGHPKPLNAKPISPTQTTYQDIALTNGRTYAYVIKFISGDGKESAPSPSVPAVPQPGPGWGN